MSKSLAALTLLAASQTALAIPVQELPAPTETARNDAPRARSATATTSVAGVATQTSLSLGGGLASSLEDFVGYYTGGALTYWGEQGYVSLRGEYMHTSHDADSLRDDGDCCYSRVNEAALTAGLPLTTNRILWAGAGVARVQRSRGEAQAPDFVRPGGVLELVLTTPLRSKVGGDFRFFVDLNGRQNFVGAMAMLRLGR